MLPHLPLPQRRIEGGKVVVGTVIAVGTNAVVVVLTVVVAVGRDDRIRREIVISARLMTLGRLERYLSLWMTG